MIAAIKADKAPTNVTTYKAAGSIEKTGNNLATRYTPATTIVAACIKADTGVGPSIASGNQICKGNIADFPAPPINIKTSPQVNNETPRKPAVLMLTNSADCGFVSLEIN